jgi:4-alpha-glucanotransferase
MSEKPPPLQPLEQLARLHGLQLQYEDVSSRIHKAEPETLRAALAALGVAARTNEQVRQSLQEAEERPWRSLAPPVLVRTIAELPCPLKFHVPASADETAEQVAAQLDCTLELTTEDGHTEELPASQPEFLARRDVGSERVFRFALSLPEHLPLGYHRLQLTVRRPGRGRRQAVALIICPERAWLPPELEGDGRRAGIAVALYGLRSRSSWGVGDFADLGRFVRWAVETVGADLVGLNPLHATANRTPYNVSPYYPISRYYRNFVYLAVPEVPDFPNSLAARTLVDSREFQSALARARAAEKVDYDLAAELKLRVLRLLFDQFMETEWPRGAESARRTDFEAYLAREGKLLDDYATFCALSDHFRAEGRWVWHEWPEQYQSPESSAVRNFCTENEREVLFHKYLQWQIDRQLAEVQTLARNLGCTVGLYHDLALGVDPAGADAWASPESLVRLATVGAPPDPLAPQGQDWAFHPPDRDAVRDDAYRLFTREIRSNCRHGGALRIDHVMRLFRLFWILRDRSAADGLYVENYAEDLLRILALESVRNRTLIIGEDLGTVPDNCRELLARFGVLSYCVFQFERRPDGSVRLPGEYPAHALATLTTHDMPPFAAFWAGRDIELRHRLGLIADGELDDARAQRRWDKGLILGALAEAGLLPDGASRDPGDYPELTGELHNAVTGFLASSPARLAVLSQEDLLKSSEQQNVPGVVDQYANWSTRMALTLEELEVSPQAVGCAAMFRGWLERTGRAAAVL